MMKQRKGLKLTLKLNGKKIFTFTLKKILTWAHAMFLITAIKGNIQLNELSCFIAESRNICENSFTLLEKSLRSWV